MIIRFHYSGPPVDSVRFHLNLHESFRLVRVGCLVPAPPGVGGELLRRFFPAAPRWVWADYVSGPPRGLVRVEVLGNADYRITVPRLVPSVDEILRLEFDATDPGVRARPWMGIMELSPQGVGVIRQAEGPPGDVSRIGSWARVEVE